MPTSDVTRGDLKLRVVSGSAPERFEEGTTEFGLQDKKKQLLSGEVRGEDRMIFDVEVGALLDDASPRFRGPYVHGKPGAYHLYVGWRYVGADGWINRLKVALAMTPDQIARALETGRRLETDATSPAWGRLKDWHGLNIGQEWSEVSES